MNLFVKSSNFSFVLGSSLDWFHQSKLSEKAGMKKNENWPLSGKFFFLFLQKVFLRVVYCIVDIYAMPFQGMRHRDLKIVGQIHTIAQTTWAISEACIVNKNN
jgi:hypothetical protein